ncbi:MAG: alpha/beta hydrolase fold domain-containing protein, partial [Cyclobacteriaceae bacterium]
MKKSIYLFGVLTILTSSLFAQSSDKGPRELIDLSYLQESKVTHDTLQRLNLVIPENKKDFPLFIWIGGGAWSYVDRHKEMDLARQFAKEGIAVATIGHRLSTATWKDPTLNVGIKHPKHIEDVASAFSWLYNNAAEYGYDKNQIFIGGYSSGAHLAALLSLDDRYLNEHSLDKECIKGVIPVAGAYDISDYHKAFLNGSRKELAKLHVQAVFGDSEADFAHASPTEYLDRMKVPMLLICESNTHNYTQILEDKILKTGFK